MVVYEFDSAGKYLCTVDVPDGTTILPANMTWAPPPPEQPGYRVRFDAAGRQWRYIADSEPEAPSQTLTPIVIESVTGNESGFDNAQHEYTARLGSTLTLTGPLAVADKKMMVPCKMRDTGRTIVAVADVVDEQMTMTLTLPELGYWEITEAMLNEGLPEPHFALSPPLRFVVI